MGPDTARNDDGYIGKPLRRREDVRFVRGQGRYVDDVVLPGLVWCAFVRSPHAHARISSLSTRAAAARPGVLLTLTADDWAKAGHGELTVVHPMPFGDGRPMNARRARPSHATRCTTSATSSPRWWPTPASPPRTRPRRWRSITSRCPRSPPRATRSRRARRWCTHSSAAISCSRSSAGTAARPRRRWPRPQRSSSSASRTTGSRPIRWSRAPISATTTPRRDRYTLYATTQQPHYLRRWLSVYTLHIPEHKIRVVSPDVGGGFGVKGNFAVEVSTVVWAARLLRRPVKWTATRTETFLSDAQARDHDTIARMGFDRRRPHRRDAGRHARGARRLSQQLRAEHSGQFLSADGHRPLPHAEPASAGARRLHQHGAGRRLSRLRPAGGDLDQRAADRARRARARHRRGRDAPAQSDRARRFPLLRAGRARLRFRRSAGAARQAVDARGLSPRCGASRPSCAGGAC